MEEEAILPAVIENDSPFGDISEPVNGLLILGALRKTVQVAGHTFGLRTLKIGEELAIGEVAKPYMDGVQQMKAFATATVAASIETLDGRKFMDRLGPDDTEYVRQKFDYITANWFYPTVDALYEHFTELLQAQIDAFEELQGN